MATPSRYILIMLIGLALSFGADAQNSLIAFKENKGQWNKAALYKAEMGHSNVYFENTSIVYQIYDTTDLRRIQHHPWQIEYKAELNPIIHGHAFAAEFLHANPSTGHIGSSKEDGYYNYFVGKDKSKWASYVSAYRQLRYTNVYDGIDLKVYSLGTDLKYDWIVKSSGNHRDPGAVKTPIQIRYNGTDGVKVADNRLVIKTSVGSIIESEPYAYQEIDGKKIDVACNYTITEEGAVSFEFPKGWNQDYDLVIDPTLIFATYSGSTADNFGYTATYDDLGYAYVAGSVFGNIGQFPTTLGAFQTVWGGGWGIFNNPSQEDGAGVDVGINKYSPDGTRRIWCTLLGGNGDELPHSLVVNTNGELFVFGTTASTNFPVTASAFDTSFNGGPDPGQFYGLGVHFHSGSDIFVTHFNAAGSALIGSTYIGGSDNDGLNYPEYQGLNYQYADEVRGAIDLDKNGNVYVASCTRSADFPVTTGAMQTTMGGPMDGVVFKMNDNLTTLVWSTYLGGSAEDACYSLALDNADNVFVCGGTVSPNFPTTTGVYQTTNNGGIAEGYISLINKNGNSLIRSTMYGTPEYDQLFFVQTDRNNNVYVLGQTLDTTAAFTHNALYNIPKSGQYISKFNYTLDTLIWSTRFGTGLGRPDISPTAFLVDVCNSVYVSGWGSYLDRETNPPQGPDLSTTGMYVTPGAFQTTTDGQDFYVMIMKDDASAITYATYFGSPTDEEHVDGGTSRFDKKGVIYQAICAGCYVCHTSGGNTTCAPDQNLPTYPAAVVSHTNNSFNCNNAVFKLDLNLPIVVADFVAPTTICDSFNYSFVNNSKIIDTPTAVVYWNFGDGTTSSQLNPSHLYTAPGTYTITLVLTDATSCNGSDTVRKQITILANDSTAILPPLSTCLGTSVQIGIPATNDSTITYQWSPSTGVTDPTLPNPYVTPTGNINYTLIATKGTCRTLYKQQLGVVTDSLIAKGSNVLCPNDTIQLYAKDTAGHALSYSWTPVIFILSGSNTDSPLVKPASNTTFYVTATDLNNGCVYKDSIYINVVSTLQYLTVTATPDTILYADSSQLNAVYTQASSLYWNPDTTLSSIHVSNPTADPRTTTTYTVTVADSNGCKVKKDVTVFVKMSPCLSSNLFVPDAFSPNNDGRNDKLYVRGNYIQDIYFAVYDRWGQKMFETRDQNVGWDGLYHGKKLDPAVFGWYVEGTCEQGQKFFKKGNVTLLR